MRTVCSFKTQISQESRGFFLERRGEHDAVLILLYIRIRVQLELEDKFVALLFFFNCTLLILFLQIYKTCFSRFSSLLLLILLGAFLAFSSLGAGSDERTRTPLGAHQRRF
jgi:hypothetical protein